MVFRIDPTLAANVISQRPGSNPNWVNPTLLAEERRKTDTQAALAIAGMMSEERTARRGMEIEKQRFHAEGHRLAAKGTLDRQEAARQAAAELFKVQKEGEFKLQETLIKETAANERSAREAESKERIAAGDVAQKDRALNSESAIKKWEKRWTTFVDKPMEHLSKMMLQNADNAAAAGRAKEIAKGIAGQHRSTAAVGLYTEWGRNATETAKSFENSAAQSEEKSQKFLEFLEEVKSSQNKAKGTPGAADDLIAMIGGGAGISEEAMREEYVGITGEFAPTTWDAPQLASFLHRAYADRAEQARESARNVLRGHRDIGGGLLMNILKSDSARAEGGGDQMLQVLSDLISTQTELNEAEGLNSNYGRALQRDVGISQLWRGVGEKVLGLPAAPHAAQ